MVIPTYEVGKPEKNPIFMEKRVYQGSSGVVYPYPVIESIANEPSDHEYQAVWLENEYIKLMILPELGGRVQMAYDKIKERHFVYYNHVIKPALVGLLGPWISGGIEFNWPQHHRPTTFMPVDSTIEDNADGSVTVWVSERERMFGQKGMAGFTLRPGCAYLEIRGKLYNPTPLPQTFLWWANPAVAVNDDYQSVFPADVNAVFDHGKRAVSSFPIATGTYYKMDYSAGVDISNYKNIKVPTSYMAVNSKYNFEGGYENDTHGGMLHVASNHFSPGKKQWTWGNGDFGQAWDRNLTDEDGPYIELMAGVYTENQPDFTWLMPYEEKQFTQYFMPYRELGIVKNASKDVVVNLDPVAGSDSLRLRLMTTSRQHMQIILRSDDGQELLNREMTLTPNDIIDEEISLQGVPFNSVTFIALPLDSADKTPMLTWHSESDEIRPTPAAAEAALHPAEIKTNEQLYLTGLHLEQYRHATFCPTDYYEEALRRDPDDYRCNNQMGLWFLRRGCFAKAEPFLRRAVKTLMRRNPNPYDGEPIYNLALTLKFLGHDDEAYSLFWKATWNKAWADAAYFEAAQLSLKAGRLTAALDEIDRCISFNANNHRALALRATVLRLLGEKEESLEQCVSALAKDAFNYGARYEQYLLTGDGALLDEMKKTMRKSASNYDMLGLDYLNMGRPEEALAVWTIAKEEGATTPMTYYYMAACGKQSALGEAAVACPDYCFPNKLEDVPALSKAMEHNPQDARAPYYLGCLFYGARQYSEAISLWEQSAAIDDTFPTVWRNLAIAYYNKRGLHRQALELMERAFALDETDSRLFMELTQLYGKMQYPVSERLQMMERHPELVGKRDDLLLEYVTLLNSVGRYSEAKQLIDNHIFHPWEGGEGKVSGQYQFCRIELAKKSITDGNYEEAIKLLKECLVYPHNLGEGKLYGAQENDIYYLLGIAYKAVGNAGEAQSCWEKATEGPQEPAAALYYNDAKPDKIFYQGMALMALGREGEARGRFYKLVNYGKNHIFEKQVIDYFAVSLPDLQIWETSLDSLNAEHCNYMLALGYLGLGDSFRAEKYMNEVERSGNSHQGVMQMKTFMTM